MQSQISLDKSCSLKVPLVATFSLTLFTSAFLMFFIQPMAGKMLLPLVGGTPAGWIVTLAFFQIMLLAGYLLAHLLSALTPRAQGLVYLALLLAGAGFLPPHLPASLPAGSAGAFDVLRALASGLALPCLALSAAASTFQRLFTTTGHPAAGDPYFLYAASNLGSFAGLLAYPLLAEPLAGLALQGLIWQIGFMALTVMCMFCLAAAGKNAPATQSPQTGGNAISLRIRLQWVLLAFIPSGLLSAVTTHITTDIFSAPMLWALPLGLYLLTFVAAFSSRNVFAGKALAWLHPLLAALAFLVLTLGHFSLQISWGAAALHLAAFTAAAMACHSQLAAMRPHDSRAHLTDFYLMIALGGALGGSLNAFVVPYVFDRLIEYPLFLMLSLLVALPAGKRAGRFIAIAGLALVAIYEFIIPAGTVRTERNFFGMVRIVDSPMSIDGRSYTARYMYHGTTVHGLQIMEPPYNKTPTTYFTAQGPLGTLFTLYNPGKVAVVGLGAGTLQCYAAPDTRMTFIEIDPAVVDIARKQFTFLQDCATGNAPRIITGDGRIELQKLDETFDLIILDAFSADTLPVHLMTTDTLRGYAQKLSDHGIIVLNISNRYFNLAPIVTRNADAAGLQSRAGLHYFDAGQPDIARHLPYATPSFWMALAKPTVSLAPLDAMNWVELAADPALRPWTDDYTNPARMLLPFYPARKIAAAHSPPADISE